MFTLLAVCILYVQVYTQYTVTDLTIKYYDRVNTHHKKTSIKRADFASRTLAALNNIVEQDWKREMLKERGQEEKLHGTQYTITSPAFNKIFKITETTDLL